MKKKFLCLLLSALIILSVIPITANAAATSGSISSSVSWSYNSSTQTLTLSGSGYVSKTYSKYSTPPWNDYVGSITNLVISNGITGISSTSGTGDYYFTYGMTGLKNVYTNLSISLPSGVSKKALSELCGSSHTWGDYEYNTLFPNKGHYQVCSVCGEEGTASSHGSYEYKPNESYPSYHKQVCSVCGYTVSSRISCEYGSTYTNAGAQHYRVCTDCGYEKYENHSYNNSLTCKCGAEKHEHDWRVTANGNKLTVKCEGTSGTCDRNKDGGTLTVSAPANLTYDGEGKKATVNNQIDTDNSWNDSSYTLTYYKSQNGGWTQMYYNSTPSDLGSYQARVTSAHDSSVYAFVDFMIAKGPMNITAEDYNGKYDGKAHKISVTAPNKTDVYYSNSASGPWYSFASEYFQTAFTDVGENLVYYKVKDTDDYYTGADEVIGSRKVKITPADLNEYIDVTAEGLTVPFSRYDYSIISNTQVNHSIKVNYKFKSGISFLPGGHSLTVEYSTDGGSTWSKTNPKFINVGTYAVKYRISVQDRDSSSWEYVLSENFNTIEGEKTVVITKADLPFEDLVGYRGSYTGTRHYALGYSKDNVTWIPFEPWNHTFTYYEDLIYTFEWTDEDGVKKTTVASKKDGWQGRENWPNYLYQNVDEIEWNQKIGHKIKVTITDPKENYNPATFEYDVQIGPYRVKFNDVTVAYDGDEHTIEKVWAPRIVDRSLDKIIYSADGGETWVNTLPKYTDVGEYPIMWKATFDADGSGKIEDDEIRTGTNTLKITALELIVTANDNAISYGDEPAANGYTVTGFIDGDDASILEGEVTYTYDYQKGDSVGTYKITPAGLSLKEGSENYAFKYVDGALTVSPKVLSISWDKTEFIFDGSEQGPVPSFNNLEEGDEVIPTYEGSAINAGEDYPAQALSISGADAGNYVLPNDISTLFDIKKAPQNKPDVEGIDETAYNAKDGQIKGLKETMEYRAKGSEEWIPVTDPEVKLAPGTYEVRYSGNSNYEPSEAAEAVINPAEKLPQDPPKVTGIDETAPNKNDGQIDGLDKTMEYRVKGSEEWISVTDPDVKLAPGTYEVRYKETDTHKASEPTEVVINPAKASDKPATGDDSNLNTFAFLFIIASVGLVSVVMIRRRNFSF